MRLQPILHSDIKDHQILLVGRPKICPTNSKWRIDGRHLDKMDKLLYFSNGSTDFYEILHADAHKLAPEEIFKKSI